MSDPLRVDEAPALVGGEAESFQPKRRGSLADEVGVHLRDLILTGKARPGQRIDQEAISRELGVSRSPIREAVVVLAQEGLVRLSPNRGAFVADITPEDITEHYEVFGALSGRAAALAAELLTDDDLDALTAVHRRFEHGTLAEMSEANHSFHRIINSVAPRRTRWLLALLERSVPAHYYEFSDGLYANSIADHRAILDALVARDHAAARWAMEHHLCEGGRAATGGTCSARLLERNETEMIGTNPDFDIIRTEVRRLCDKYGNEYWRSLEPDRYPTEFVADLTEHGWLAALIPESYGGGGLSLAGASVILEEIAASGGNPSACHAQMYIMGTLLRHGSDEQKQRYLPRLAAGEISLQAFGVTEPEAGSETTSIRTRAERDGDTWRINGQKVWTSRALHSDMMILLARTTPADEGDDRLGGLSVFLFDLRDDSGDLVPGLTINPIATWMNHNTTEVFFDDVVIPADALVGTEGMGFRHILDGMNAERILIAAECIGDGKFFLERASSYARERHVFGRPIGSNQGVAFPLAQAYANLAAADLMRWRAAELFDAGESCGAEANMAKMLASNASWEAGNAALNTHGGYGFAVEYDIERKLRETRLYQVAPINNNLVLAFVAQKCLGLPKSY